MDNGWKWKSTKQALCVAQIFGDYNQTWRLQIPIEAELQFLPVHRYSHELLHHPLLCPSANGYDRGSFRPYSAHAMAGVEECTLVADSLSSTLLFHGGSGDSGQESGSGGAHQHTSSQHPGPGCWSHSFPGSMSGVVWSKQSRAAHSQ